MASKLDTILVQLKEITDTLQNDSDERILNVVAIVTELVQFVSVIQDECIKLLQERTVDDKKVAQPAFRWDSLRSDTSPFKAPYGPFFD
tara:strand:+ start:33 stop:299 length:267 start_codon:yes stop_codon:yes gene_type:complete